MNGVLVMLLIAVVAMIALAMWSSSRASGNRNAVRPRRREADTRRVIERASAARLINLTGTDTASQQALADASEQFTAASSQIEQATTAKQAMLAKESALEGLYYVRAARLAMNMDPGPELETISGQKSAGVVTEDRRIEFEGRQVEASPTPTQRTPNYFPGGRVAGRPVPAGWYSEPWWACIGGQGLGTGSGVVVRRAVLRDVQGGLQRGGVRGRLRHRLRPGL